MKDYKSDKIKIQEKIKGIENKLKNNKLDLRGYYIEVRSIVEELDKTLIPEYFPSFSKMVPSFLVERFRGFGKNEIMTVGVRAIIPYKKSNRTYDKNKILLQLRSDVKVWGIPSGMVDMGEKSIENALKREVFEETGLNVLNYKLIAKTTNRAYTRFTYPNGDKIRSYDDMFEITDYTGEVRLDKTGEGLNLKFFHIDKMPKNFLDFHKIPLKQYKEYLKTGKVIIG